MCQIMRQLATLHSRIIPAVTLAEPVEIAMYVYIDKFHYCQPAEVFACQIVKSFGWSKVVHWVISYNICCLIHSTQY